jgi:hypothetical protein
LLVALSVSGCSPDENLIPPEIILVAQAAPTANGERETEDRLTDERETVNGERPTELGDEPLTDDRVPLTDESDEPLTDDSVTRSPLTDKSDDCCVFSSSLRAPGPPLVIVKTNLLYDVALTPHLGVEVPIGERFSVGAEFMRGWWLKSDWSFCWQLEAAALEGRYWFSPLSERHLRGGWFAGVLVQGAFYDFQLQPDSGVQGECLMAGLTGGYLYPLSTHWSLEFSLGLGYLRTNYRQYTVEPTHKGHELVRSTSPMRLTGVLYPLKAGISIQWAFRSHIKRRTP